MRRTHLIMVAWLLCSRNISAQTAGPALQSRVERVIVRELGWNMSDPALQPRLQVLAPELRLPAEARLHVAAVHPCAGAGTWLLRLECSRRVECLPFEVRLQMRGQDNRSIPGAATDSLAEPGNSLAPPVVRAGQRVLLSEEASGMHLSAPAICLQAGRLGQRIRVRNVASGRVVLARVGADGVTVED